LSILYIVATPIGNLGDFSKRAADTLRQADHIACEDTRTSGVLFKEFGIDKPLFSFHLHNEHQKVQHIMNILDGGQTVAIVSDAGMPGISDPGFPVIYTAHQQGHTVSVIPRPYAATTAHVASRLPCDRYTFEGFLPPKKGRQTRIQAIAESDITSVIYVSPHKIVRFLNRLSEFSEPSRWICIARELTKKFEEIDRGRLSEITEAWEGRDTIKGEIVVVVAGKEYDE